MPFHQDEDKTDIAVLEEIMAMLPDPEDHTNCERRRFSLTQEDVLVIYRIAKAAGNHHCPFEKDESDALKSVAQNMNRTQKIATIVFITGSVTAILSGMWYMIVHVAVDWVQRAGTLPK